MKGRKKEGEGGGKRRRRKERTERGKKTRSERERERESVLAKETWKREDKEEGRRARITPRRVVATPF